MGKLPPAVGTLRQSLGLSLVDAGFLLSTVQLAGMTAAIAVGAWADSFGLKRSMVAGLLVLAGASGFGGLATTPGVLLALRAVEGFGFLLVVLPAPGLVRRIVPPGHLNAMLGLWACFMPLGTALALLAGPLWLQDASWNSWWWALGIASLLMALLLAAAVPSPAAVAVDTAMSWPARLRVTLAHPGPWLVALTFAAYSSQWLGVIGFLPTIYEQAGVAPGARGLLTALAAAVNMAGNLAAGRLLQRGVAPFTLLRAGFIAMALGALVAFMGAGAGGAPAWLRYLAVLAFSALGGLIPATLFSLALRVAPGERTIATSVGWMQQWSAFGQFAGPPLVAWVASRAGGWHFTWAVSAAAGALGLALSALLRRATAPRDPSSS